jgi:metal-responsive CopG/Arc/MetJ family transcriptional regulator
MKTAVSIPDDLFQSVEKLSKVMHCSRSRVIAEALRDYLEKMRNRRMLDALNKVYSQAESTEEAVRRRLGKKRYAELLKAERW